MQQGSITPQMLGKHAFLVASAIVTSPCWVTNGSSLAVAAKLAVGLFASIRDPPFGVSRKGLLYKDLRINLVVKPQRHGLCFCLLLIVDSMPDG
jgi:hypothetical protein